MHDGSFKGNPVIIGIFNASELKKYWNRDCTSGILQSLN